MRSVRLLSLALVTLMLIACQPTGTQVVPTVAQLPSPTPEPTSAPTDETFFTPTPAGEAVPAGEVTQGAPTESPTEGGGEVPGAFASPTPETEIVLTDTGATTLMTGPCSETEMRAVLASADLAALRTDLDAFVAGLRTAAGSLAGWTLDTEPDPLAGVVMQGILPIATLRYQRNEGEEVTFLVSLTPGAIGDFLRQCLSTETFFHQSDVPEGAVFTLEPLDIGDQGILATITVPTSPEIVQSEMGNITTTVGAVLVGDRYIQYISTAPFATPTPQEDALALLEALVEAVRGQ